LKIRFSVLELKFACKNGLLILSLDLLLRQNFFKSVLGTPCKIDILLDGDRQMVDVPVADDKTEKFPLYIADETVKGKVQLTLEPGQKKIEHAGIKIYFVGTISTICLQATNANQRQQVAMFSTFCL
jgi:hypothetical protein